MSRFELNLVRIVIVCETELQSRQSTEPPRHFNAGI